MTPGLNPRMMKQAMQRMGIHSVDIDATEVIIKCSDKEIIISNPSVSKVNMMGQNTYQIIGQEEERALRIDISDDDIATVMDQADVSREQALRAINEHDGDLAAAILSLKKD
jgi:nascent polypeptide-associated complex subunit alpha